MVAEQKFLLSGNGIIEHLLEQDTNLSKLKNEIAFIFSEHYAVK